MKRAFCIITMFVLMLGAAPLAAQQPPPPAFHTTPASPAPGQSFQGTLSVYAFAAAIGVWSSPEVSGNTVTVNFDFGCGFICPGGDPSYHDFTFAMPALPAGNYTVRVVFSNDAIATFPLIVGGVAPPAAIAAPALGLVSAAALAMLLLVAGLRRRNA